MQKQIDSRLPEHIQEFIFSSDSIQLIYLISFSAQHLVKTSILSKEDLLSALESILEEFIEE